MKATEKEKTAHALVADHLSQFSVWLCGEALEILRNSIERATKVYRLTRCILLVKELMLSGAKQNAVREPIRD